ncbi:hypothetical protein ACFE04_000902 [Oxalis oulophora]
MEKSNGVVAEFDVIVIGGGVIGSSTAYQLAKRGSKTLLLEQFDFLHHRGSSHGESRTIRATYTDEYYVPLVLEAALLWEEAEKEIGFNVLFKSQHLDMGSGDDKALCSVIASCKKHGIAHEVMDAERVRDKFSGRFELPDNWIGVCTELGGIIKPTKAVSMFQTLAIKNGATLRDNKEVQNIIKDEVKGGVTVVTSNGEKYWGKKCILTVGAWTRKLLKLVNGTTLPIQPLETALYYWRIKEGHENEFVIGSGFPTFASYGEPYFYGTPVLEYPGLIKVGVHGGNQCDPDKRPWRSEGIKMDILKEWIEKRFKGLVKVKNGPVCGQMCMYSMTPDEDYVIDFLGGEFGKDVAIGGGFSGHGFKMAPVVGRILADLVLDGEAKGVELKHFRIGRFEENPNGNVK